MPTTETEADSYALVFQGQRYNALGQTLAGLTTLGGTQTAQELVTGFVNRGDGLILLRLYAAALDSAAQTSATLWSGHTRACCTSAADAAACAKEAAAGCFGGGATFTLPPGTLGASVSGSIKATGKLALGPASLRLKLPLFQKQPLELTLKYATISGVVDAGGVTSGILSGAVTAADHENKVMPALTLLLDRLYKDPKVATILKAILSVADLNRDGTITSSELKKLARSSPLLSMQEGDLDIDGDGQKEWTLGFGFTAAPCAIK